MMGTSNQADSSYDDENHYPLFPKVRNRLGGEETSKLVSVFCTYIHRS